MSYGIAGDAVQMSSSLEIDYAGLERSSEAADGDPPVGSATAKRERSRRSGGRLVTARIFRHEQDRLGEQISRANSRTMRKYLPLDAGLGFDHSDFRRFTRSSAAGRPQVSDSRRRK
jgi:hypothetical protein